MFKFWKKKEPEKQEPPKSGFSISDAAVIRTKEVTVVRPQFKKYEPPKGVLPENTLAMDSCDYDYINSQPVPSVGGYDSVYFRGYPYLAALSKRAEYRTAITVLAEEMCRKWIELKYEGDKENDEKLKKLEDAIKLYKVKDHVRKVLELDGFFGRGQIYIDVKKPSGGQAWEDYDELKTPLIKTPEKVKQDSLLGFTVIEPMWTYPGIYNADNPLDPTFYNPEAWYIMGKTVDKSRLITVVSKPLPDIYKAAYNFGGISLIEMLEPYINNWLRTRDSVSDIIHSFVTAGILTDMTQILTGGDGNDIYKRAQIFNNMRDNRGLMMLNKDSEEFFQYSVPLSGLSDLQAQSQEHVCSISRMPLVKYTGITPSGLNATSDGEIRVFYDTISAMQEHLLRPILNEMIDYIQLSEFGEIDSNITYEFVPLYELSEIEEAQVKKLDAETDATYAGSMIIANENIHERIAKDPRSPFFGMKLNEPVLEEEILI